MLDLNHADLLTITGGECYSAAVEIFGLEIGIHIGACAMR